MRYLTRLNVLGGLAFFSFLIALRLVYVSGYGLPIRVNWGAEDPPPLAETTDHKLVVFGDAWSYTGSRLRDQGMGWPEWVCSQWPCSLENYAQHDHACEGPFCGSVVDDLELQKINSEVKDVREPLPDLRAQVDRWLTVEHEAMRNDPATGDMKARMNSTVFAVSFVIWDAWKFLHVPMNDEVKNSISRSVDSLFEQLSRLPAESGTNDVRVVLMLSIDPTFLPAFDATTGQKDMVAVVEKWNRDVQEKAKKWEGGSIYIFDTDEFLLDQIRGYQFYAAGMLDGNGLWEQNPWDNVDRPCVESTGKWLTWLGNNGKQCDNPDKFLFWDGMHLGPVANEMIGKEIFHGIETSWIKNDVSFESESHQSHEAAEPAADNVSMNRRKTRRDAGVSSRTLVRPFHNV